MNDTRIVPILAGGGTRLSAHIGILTALQELQLEFDHLVGVSGGSIVGALYASGRSVESINSIANETDFSQFLSQSLYQLLRSGGLSSGDSFEEWIDQKLNGATFEDLRLDFHVVATDVRTGRPVIFDRQKTPQLKVSKAVRFSMSIPILFSFKQFKDHLLVDGSILSEDALQRDWSGKGDPVLCFRLRSLQEASAPKRNPIIPLGQYLAMLVRTFMTTMSREYINDTFWHSTVVVQAGTISPIDFKLTAEQKSQLFKAGYDTALRIVPMKLQRNNAAAPMFKQSAETGSR
ncbi:patatin-like phospholipase family protein [Motiliproteus sp.]|uniref:patatin-like phospholipase family protein n=1 Tax=Motiliproteus sp. TaxID=1898955 RepID=UPI003BAD6DE2